MVLAVIAKEVKRKMNNIFRNLYDLYIDRSVINYEMLDIYSSD